MNQQQTSELKERVGYSGKPQQWQYGFDLACRELNLVSEGCVVVPVEPTDAMHKAFYEGKSMSYSVRDKAEFYDDYSAMIQAAREDE